MKRTGGYLSSNLQVELLEDRRLLSATSSLPWLLSQAPAGNDVPAAARGEQSGDGERQTPARTGADGADNGSGTGVVATSSDRQLQTDDRPAPPTRDSGTEVRLAAAVESLVSEFLSRLPGESSARLSSESPGRQKNEGDGRVNAVADTESAATQVVAPGDDEVAVEAVFKRQPAASAEKAITTTAPVKEEEDPSAIHKPAAADDRTALLAVVAAQARGDRAAESGLEAATAAAVILGMDGTLAGSSPASISSSAVRGYSQDFPLERGLPCWIASSSQEEVSLRYGPSVSAILSDGSSVEEMSLAFDQPQQLAAFTPEPAALDINVDQLLNRVDRLGNEVSKSLAGAELARWLIALVTAGTALAAIRRRRAPSDPGLNGEANNPTNSWVANLPEAFSTETV
jgi:hypothetical protein